MKRKLVILTVIALAVLGGGYGTETAQAKTFKSSADAMHVIKWQQKQIIIQKKIVRTKQMWISTGPSVAYLHILNENDVAAHQRYISLLRHKINRNLAVYKKLKKKESYAPAVPLGYPPHHSLWVCIGRFEGGVTSVNPNGHYGMLQMGYDWLGYIKGRASDYSQAVQEWAAEKAWKANNYSYSFLYNQWFAYDAADGCYRA